ncbi:MAG: F0F1 ATP synthase subunit gamma, partial [Planctomycetota bacterium]
NRGLCGGYNTNVLALAERFLEAERAAGREPVVVAVGKKAVARLRFRKIPVALAVTSIGDTPTLEGARELCRTLREKFESGEVSRVVVVATRYFSSGLQRPVEIQLLPFSLEKPPVSPLEAPAAAERPAGGRGDGAPGGEGLEVIFEPRREEVVDALVPLAVEYALYKILLEARASEHVARRVAMKTATDNAETMIRTYTTSYNRQRQAGITRQIVEVVSGADALG